MRKIEQDMLQAIKERRNWKSGNTEVSLEGGWCYIKLYGNIIATNVRIVGNDPWHKPKPTEPVVYRTAPVLVTFKQWPTAATASRLRALGINASIKNGVAHIDGKPV